MSIDSPFGKISIFEENGFVVKIGFFSEACAAENSGSPTLKAAAAQLEEYFSGGRKDFSVPLNPQGTDFQKKVWRAAEKLNSDKPPPINASRSSSANRTPREPWAEPWAETPCLF